MDFSLDICLEREWLYSCFDEDKVEQGQSRLIARGIGRKQEYRATELARGLIPNWIIFHDACTDVAP